MNLSIKKTLPFVFIAIFVLVGASFWIMNERCDDEQLAANDNEIALTDEEVASLDSEELVNRDIFDPFTVFALL